MKKYIFFVIVLVILVFYFGKSFYSKNYFKKEMGNCSVIVKNEGNKKIDIVFLSDNVGKEDIKKEIDFFLDSYPYSENKNKFNFFYAGETSCKVINDFVFCYSKDALKKAAHCPNDYIVVLSDQTPAVRSSAYLNFISLNVNHPKNVFLHEFGHVFSNLADEYVYSIIPKGSENCKKKCEEFNNLGGCFKGCSEDGYFRSMENSVMRTSKSKEYGEFNNLIINKNLQKYG